MELSESPKYRARHRDRLVQEGQWDDEDGKQWSITQTPECHLWKIVSEETQQAHAYLGVYVDDLLMVGEKKVCEDTMNYLATKFHMQPHEEVTVNKGIMFCGYEIDKEEIGDFVLSHSKYVEEILRRRGVQRAHGHPLPKVMEGLDEEGVTPQEIRAAQMAAGELMWVATRTRPDVSYATSLVSRLLHRRPRYAKEMADCIFGYLAGTVRSGPSSIRVNVDASFAPPHAKSIHGVLICTLVKRKPVSR